MNTKNLILFISAGLGGSAVTFAGSQIALSDLSFIAPTVSGVDNVPNPDPGLVVYDATDDAVKVKKWSAGWSVLTPTAGVAVPVVLSSAATLTASEDVVLANAVSSAFTVSLPPASTAGKVYYIKKTDSSTANAVTIDANASETIDGALTKTLSTQNESITIVSDGSNWRVLQRTVPSVWISYTPTGSWSGTYAGKWRRVGDTMEGDINISSMSASGGLTVNLPSGFAVDFNKLAAGTGNSILGHGGYVTSSASYPVDLELNSSTSFLARVKNSASTYVFLSTVSAGQPVTVSSSDTVTLRFAVPISGWEN